MDKEMKKIIERAIKRDGEALDLLIQEKMPDVLYITYLFADKNYEDASQEVLYNIVKNIHTLKKPEYFNTWMFRLAKNICSIHNMQYTKLNKVELSIEMDERDDFLAEGNAELLPESSVLNQEKKNVVLACINQLPKQYKEMLVMKHFKDMSHAQIAEVLGVTKKVVYNGLTRGRTRLKELLAKNTNALYGLTLPMLTEAIKADSLQIATPKALEALTNSSKDIIASQSVESITTASSNGAGSGVLTKILITGIVFTTAIGITAGSLRDNPVEIPLPTVETQMAITPPTMVEKTIETLGDMIGEDNAITLINFADNGAKDYGQWQQFLEKIEMTNENQSNDNGEIYATDRLEKQDKRLVINYHTASANGPVTIQYDFGLKETIAIPTGGQLVELF